LKDIQHMFVTVTAMDKKMLTPQTANWHEQVRQWGQAVNRTCSAPSAQLPSWFSTFPSKSHHDVCLLPWSNHCSMLIELPNLNSQCSTGCIPPAGYQFIYIYRYIYYMYIYIYIYIIGQKWQKPVRNRFFANNQFLTRNCKFWAQLCIYIQVY
jgi:hypothetical protein